MISAWGLQPRAQPEIPSNRDICLVLGEDVSPVNLKLLYKGGQYHYSDSRRKMEAQGDLR